MWPARWLRWLGGERQRPDLFVVLYTRSGCHLCTDAWTLLEAERQRFGFRLESRDIDANPTLAAQYGLCVPVVTVNDKVRFRGRVNGVLLRRLLQARPSEAT